MTSDTLPDPRPLIGIVGACGAGKSTLAGALRARGYNARQVSQEHSGVPDLWRRFTHADLLIYLDISLDTLRMRQQDPEWPAWLFERQRERLAVARANCDLYLQTDDLSPEEVLARALGCLDHLSRKTGGG